MTNQAANFLLLSICLSGIVLSGGVVGGLAPGGVAIGISLDGSDIVCPEGGKSDERVIKPCAESKGQPPNSLFAPLFSLPESGLSIEGDDEETNPASDTPTASASTPPGSSQSETTPGENSEEGTGDESTSTSVTEEDPESTAVGQTQAGSTPTEAPTPTVSQSSDIDFGVPLHVLIIGGLLTVALLVSLASIYAYRRGYIDSPWDVMALMLITFNWLLTFIVRVSVGVADELRTVYVQFIGAITGRSPSAPSTGYPDLRTVLNRLMHRGFAFLKTIAVLLGVGEAVRDFRSDRKTDSSGLEYGSIDEIEALIEDDFDIGLAWGWLANQTGAVGTAGRTPEEIARAAQAQGYPGESVTALLDAFRDVTYGEHDLSPKQREAATEAFEQLVTAGRTVQGPTGGE